MNIGRAGPLVDRLRGWIWGSVEDAFGVQWRQSPGDKRQRINALHVDPSNPRYVGGNQKKKKIDSNKW